MVTRTVPLALLASLVACGADEPAEGTQQPDAPATIDYEPLAAHQLLTRSSLDLRGVRPSVEELARVNDDPAALDALVDDFLTDERFEGQVQELFTDVFLTRTDAYLVDAFAFPLPREEQEQLQRASGEEPVRIVARVAAEDRPIDEIVTADWTLSNDLLDQVYPVERAETGDWSEATYVDGRPAAGVLSTNGLWWRYDSTFSNANRKRANAISRILLCDDYLSRPVDFDRTVNVLDEEAIENSLQDNAACASCHSTLDPLASYLYGFTWYAYGGDEVTLYHPSRELDWLTRTGQAPAYQGEPGHGLTDLGAQIAADPRFEACMVRRVTEGLLGEPVEDEVLVPHTEALQGSGRTLRAAMASVVRSPGYRAASGDDVPGGAHPAKLASPALMASQVEALSGFRWTIGAFDLMTSDLYGYLTLAGGADGYDVTEPSSAPTATMLLVHERLAEAAANEVVTQAQRGGTPMLSRVALSWTPETDRDAMVAALEEAQLSALGHAEQTEELLELWTTLHDLEGDAERAWIGVVSALLRDPDALIY